LLADGLECGLQIRILGDIVEEREGRTPMADTTNTSETTHIVIHNGVITFVGANCFEIVGQPPGYFQGRHVHELMHPEDQVRLNNVFRPGRRRRAHRR
jgi:hypothetical protein